MTKDAVQRAHHDCLGGNLSEEDLRAKLASMKKVFETRGDPRVWTAETLEALDGVFRKHYFDKGEPKGFLFFPNVDNMNTFFAYCSDADTVLKEHHQTVPPYARTYFTYAMAWKAHGHPFPIPLGTASVVYALHKFALKYKAALTEVSEIL
jgi:hypothetical protein